MVTLDFPIRNVVMRVGYVCATFSRQGQQPEKAIPIHTIL